MLNQHKLLRVAALYDVHGNLPALEAVLADARCATPTWSCRAATCAPARCRSRCCGCCEEPGALFVRGNADRELTGWPAERLAEEQLETLRSWPTTRTHRGRGSGRGRVLPRLAAGGRRDPHPHHARRGRRRGVRRRADRRLRAHARPVRPSASGVRASSTPAASVCRTRGGRPRTGLCSAPRSSSSRPTTTSRPPSRRSGRPATTNADSRGRESLLEPHTAEEATSVFEARRGA